MVMPERSDPVMGAVRYSAASTQPDVRDAKEPFAIQFCRNAMTRKRPARSLSSSANADPERSIAILVRSRKQPADILALLDRLKSEQPRFRYQAIDFNPLADTP